ncbi:transglycosylase domain-containing protein [Aeromicrobium sp. Root236]|uniref:transglycosylase domain-containing protein n=1 Tax=Aeromicrobium sp. Root236 TaxID=1736498 RepID=UPI00138ECC18|nr:transglycosylase domain-containing protein [Aeromicrobium sp. Root236]
MPAQRKKAARPDADGGRFKAFLRKIGGRGPWWLKTIRWVSLLGVLGVLFLAATFFILYRSISIPSENAAFQTQTTKVYYSDGKHVLGTFATQDRESIGIDEIPASMQAAAIAAEDRSFYSNRGIDIKGIIRAARNNATSGEIQGGGSTITQQYVKILYLTQEQSYKRKVKEAILSIKIHNQLSKKQILEGYLNTIYFGNGAYGVEVASKTYFDKPASQLNYAQSAILATIINSPTYYDPYAEGAEDRIGPRFRYVLGGMVKDGAITAEQAARFDDHLPKFAPKREVNRFSGSKGYLLQLVKEKMDALDFTPEEVDGAGYRIVTTFDYRKQKEAIAAIKAHRPAGKKELHQSLVSIKPGTGAVQAMYAGRDYLKNQFNWATERTQPGSTFKAFALIAALENGYSLKTKLNGASPLIINGKVITENQGDSGGESFGNVPLEFATQKSINTAFVDLMDQMKDGPEKTLEAAAQAGIPSGPLDRLRRDGPPLSTPLGIEPVAPVDMANAYATIAADGKRADWYIIESVKDVHGKTLHKHKVKTEQAIPKDVAADAIAAMQKVVNSGGAGTGSNAKTICPTAGKTGTATAGPDDDQHVSSSWFAGYTPKLATAVMYNRGKLGNGDLEGYMVPFFGGQIPAKTFQTYMNSALEGTDCGTFPKPANIKSSKGTTYKKPAPKCDSDEQLNDNKTKCVAKPKPKPTQERCGPNEQPDGNLGCEPKPPVTCDPPQVLDPNTNTCVTPTQDPQSSKAACEAAGGDWSPLTNPRCTLPDNNGWVFMVPLIGVLGLRRPEDDEADDAPLLT